MNELHITRNGHDDHGLMLKYKLEDIMKAAMPRINEFFETQAGHYPK